MPKRGSLLATRLPTARYDVAPETRHYRVTKPVNNLLVDRDMSDLTITLKVVKK
jgi:hypothetical protein